MRSRTGTLLQGSCEWEREREFPVPLMRPGHGTILSPGNETGTGGLQSPDVDSTSTLLKLIKIL